MTKKDYEAIAKAIAETIKRFPSADNTKVHYLTGQLAAVFKADNPRFDAERFYDEIDRLTADDFDYVLPRIKPEIPVY